MLQPNNQKREAMSIFNIIIVTLLAHQSKHASLSLARVWFVSWPMSAILFSLIEDKK